MAAEKRPPSNEPTLMIGDVDKNIDFSHVDRFIISSFPHPIKARESPTKDSTKVNYFYQYASFEEARFALRKLNGSRVPGMHHDYQLDMNFTLQNEEICSHLTIFDLHLSRTEIMKLFTRYPSVLGLAQYNFKLHYDGRRTMLTCFVRFGDKEDCMQSVRELNGQLIEHSSILTSISTRFIDSLTDYVVDREMKKMKTGMPEFHNVYPKQEVNVDRFNEMVLSTSYNFFDDLEASRWSPIAFQTNVYNMDYNRQITMDFFENF